MSDRLALTTAGTAASGAEFVSRDGVVRGRLLGSRTRSAGIDGMVLEGRLSAWMAAAQDGDAQAYRSLLRESLPVVAAAVRAQGVRGAAIQDAVQETLLTLHRARSTYDPARPFLPFLRAIAKRRAIDTLRRQSRQRHEIHDPHAFEGHPDTAPEPGDRLDKDDRRRILTQAVATLPPGQREAIEHLVFAERSLEETTTLTGRNKGALKVNLHRALKALRVRLAGDRERDGV